MKCQNCNNQATVHLTNLIDGQKTEVHFCPACAEQQKLTDQQEMNLSAFLHYMIGQHAAPTEEIARLTCPECGIKYMEFRSVGRLGCPRDYETFREVLIPLLQRIHRGASKHTGKTPRRRRPAEVEAEVYQLRQHLRAAVDSEAYEDAARFRDLLRKKEATDESG